MPMQPRKLLVFDLETVPDVELVREVFHDAAELDDAAAVEFLYAKMIEETGSDFPPPAFHKIVAIGCLLADIDYVDHGKEAYFFRRLGCMGEPEDDEATLLEKFFSFGERESLRLVSFNGRAFDVPTLKLRALKHGLDNAGWLMNGPMTGRGDKWSHYGSRFDAAWHVDLKEVMGDFGACRAGKMDYLTKLAGLPGKLDLAGDKVWELFAAHEIEKIRDYCETDVLNTYLLYLRWQGLGGCILGSARVAEELRIRDYCTLEGTKKEHLGRFEAAWPLLDAPEEGNVPEVDELTENKE